MGTHPRLGAGYEHKDEPCAVRLLDGHHDVLRAIANCVRYGRTGRVLEPRAKELFELRRLNRQLHLELHAERAHVSELSIEVANMRRQIDQGERREASAHAHAAAERRLAEAQAAEYERELKVRTLLLCGARSVPSAVCLLGVCVRVRVCVCAVAAIS